jgi:hypothetical protein
MGRLTQFRALGRSWAPTCKEGSIEESCLGIVFESGDSVDIETVENRYESVIFNFPPRDKSIVMEIS